MSRVHLILLIVLSLMSMPFYGQNLVPNPSFEELESCPDALTSSGYASYITGVDTIHDFIRLAEPWYCPTSGTSDMIAACSTNNGVSVPVNNWGNGFASDGDNYIAIIAYHNIANSWEDATLVVDYTEYVQVMLNEPLVPGEAYRMSFHYRWADNSKFAIDQLGMGLSVGPVVEGDSINPVPLDIVPQVVTPPGEVNSSTEWQFHLETFVADQAYDHLTLGRLLDYTDLTIEQMTTEVVPSTFRRAVYYMDEIEIVPVSPVGIDEREEANVIVLPEGIRLGENGTLTIYDLTGRLIVEKSGTTGELIGWPLDGSANALYLLSFNGHVMKVVNPVYGR